MSPHRPSILPPVSLVHLRDPRCEGRSCSLCAEALGRSRRRGGARPAVLGRVLSGIHVEACHAQGSATLQPGQ
ncbi:Hypothetical protein CAP_8202 [Chondromyces apiculatus DSM 436]|uniref:Uncharacterized protein n=1 Tax=Chondromyces apiculatus DSM 436 TaxID=1192034 RepID=A0A017TGI2_9BACT|nr:Hypothetical protein CAP_8202 [Chondromyces apiculatus DSM 436]